MRVYVAVIFACGVSGKFSNFPRSASDLEPIVDDGESVPVDAAPPNILLG